MWGVAHVFRLPRAASVPNFRQERVSATSYSSASMPTRYSAVLTVVAGTGNGRGAHGDFLTISYAPTTTVDLAFSWLGQIRNI